MAHDQSLPLDAHLCFMLRVHFLLREQIEVGRHDDVRSLVRSVWKDATDNNESQTVTEKQADAKTSL